MKSIKLLAITNSFGDDVFSYMYQILEALGYDDIVVSNLYIGGCTIKRHYDNILEDKHDYIYKRYEKYGLRCTEGYSIKMGLDEQPWDVIMTQQASGLSGVISTYDEKIDSILDYVIKNCKNKNVKLAWNMTWPYSKDADREEYVYYDGSQIKMYESIVNCVKTKILPNKKFTYVFPCGTAIQNLRTSFVGDTLNIDGYHLEDLGKLVTGITIALTISGKSVDDIDFKYIPCKFMPYFEVVKEAAKNAVCNNFIVTNSVIMQQEKAKIKYDVKKDVVYKDNLHLDMYIPNCAIKDAIIHFHGGGLECGIKDDETITSMADDIASNGMMFVSVEYRMYPNTKYPMYLEDANDAIMYVYKYLKDNKINCRIHISGQSAGAYIGMMLCLDNKYLKDIHIDSFIIESGQPTTHFNILRYEDGVNPDTVLIDERAPIYHAKKNDIRSDIYLIAYSDDMKGRKGQNEQLYNILKDKSKNAVKFDVFEGKHCVNSSQKYRGLYIQSKIIIDYIQNRHI